MTLIDSEALEQSDVTPSDLKAMRLRLGLDMAELAQLQGLPARRDIVENLEKARTWTMYEGHRDALQAMEEQANDVFAEITDEAESRPAVLISYPNDGVFHDFAPQLAERLRFNSVHRMILVRAQDYFYDGQTGEQPAIVEIIPTRYSEWLDGRPDT